MRQRRAGREAERVVGGDSGLRSQSLDTSEDAPIRIGISACLLGREVRYHV